MVAVAVELVAGWVVEVELVAAVGVADASALELVAEVALEEVAVLEVASAVSWDGKLAGKWVGMWVWEVG